MSPEPGSWQQQDGVVVARRREDLSEESHAQWRWNQRCPTGWEGYPVRAAWREAEIVATAGDEAVVREHAPTEMYLVAEFGVLQTAYAGGTEVSDDE